MKIPKVIIKLVTAVVGLVLAVFLVIVEMDGIAGFPKDEAVNVKGDNASIPLAATVDLMVASFLLIAGKDEAAVKWYTSAAEQGGPVAQSNLGLMYYEGTGVPQDYEAALKWWTRAAEQGYAGAQYNLGVMYLKGHGVPQDDIYAYMWFNIAALSGDKDAPKNRDTVAKWMTSAQLEKAHDLAHEWLEKNTKGAE